MVRFGFAGSHHGTCSTYLSPLLLIACSPIRTVVYGIPVPPTAFTPNVTLVGIAEIDEEDPLSSLVLAAANASAGPKSELSQPGFSHLSK